MSAESEESFARIGTSFNRAIPGQSLTSDPDKKERVRGVFSPIKKSKKGDKSE